MNISERNDSKELELLVNIIGGFNNIKTINYTNKRAVIKLKQALDNTALEHLKSSKIVHSFILLEDTLEIIPATLPAEPFVSELKKQFKHKNHQSILDKTIDFISSIFLPLLPLFAGAGILTGLLILLTTFGWLSETSDTYLILSSAANAVFYFLPVLVAFSTAKKLNVNPFIAAMLSAGLIEPSLIDLLQGETSTTTSFLGIPVVLMQYSATVIPAILATSFYSIVEKLIKKYTKENFQLVLIPLLSLIIVVPITLIAFGPLGIYLGEALGYVVNGLMSVNGLISGAIIASGWMICVIFGLHWALYPIIISNIAILGYDLILPLTGIANFAMLGATLAVFLNTKNQQRRSIAASGFASLSLAGIAEPSLYGVTLPLKRPFIASCIGSAVGGAVAGAFQTKTLALVFVSIPSLPAFITDTFIYFLISIIIGFVVAFIATLALGFDKNK
ncbi:PTS transporter subunit EIIC [Alkalihalobacillus sp. 1P02AB]|uniref:PTS transporter subunit EIIC n=1 Tax=Alkalihalobacillus sp. 1P02AB TaxID=3132260 RepID=UPI0039A4FBBF